METIFIMSLVWSRSRMLRGVGAESFYEDLEPSFMRIRSWIIICMNNYIKVMSFYLRIRSRYYEDTEPNYYFFYNNNFYFSAALLGSGQPEIRANNRNEVWFKKFVYFFIIDTGLIFCIRYVYFFWDQSIYSRASGF